MEPILSSLIPTRKTFVSISYTAFCQNPTKKLVGDTRPQTQGKMDKRKDRRDEGRGLQVKRFCLFCKIVQNT